MNGRISFRTWTLLGNHYDGIGNSVSWRLGVHWTRGVLRAIPGDGAAVLHDMDALSDHSE